MNFERWELLHFAGDGGSGELDTDGPGDKGGTIGKPR